MEFFSKKIEGKCIYDARVLGKGTMLLLGFQHLFAMFGATILVPIITGLSVTSTLLFAGIGTLLFHSFTKLKVPVFLGSSFAFLCGYASIKTLCQDGINWIPYAGIGVVAAGFIYIMVALLIKLFGIKKIIEFFPPVVTSPIIIAIGLSLSKSAVENCYDNLLYAVVSIIVVLISMVCGKGMIKIIPIFFGVVVSYFVAVVTGGVDLGLINDAKWIGVPVRFNDTVLSLINNCDLNVEFILTSIVVMAPIALATVVEHIGDIYAISAITHYDYVINPGLHRTLMGDGFATMFAALFGAPANTTYGENTGVLALSRVYDPKIIRIAASFTIFLSFCPKFAAIINSIPLGTIGGVSLVLYGMISSVGICNLVKNNVNFTEQRNVLIVALILVLSIGINYSTKGMIVFTIKSIEFSFTGLSVGSIVGIIANAIIPKNKSE